MDCIISGISLYTQNLLLVLAYCLPEDDEDDEDETPQASPKGHRSQPSGSSTETKSGIRRRRLNNQPPELRLIDLESQTEVDKDGLSLGRYERLSSRDYHLGILPAQNAASAVVSHRGALGAIAGLGSEMWNAAINPRALFSSGASMMSRGSGDDAASGSRISGVGNSRSGPTTVHPNLVKPGAKIFIHSPYDCILATKRDLGDHLNWLLEHHQYKQAWELLDESPEILSAPAERPIDVVAPSTPGAGAGGAGGAATDQFFDDTSSVNDLHQSLYTSAAKEKRRIGELWIQDLVEAGDWATAGQVCGRVLNTPDRWEKWVWTFAGAKKFDEIVNYIPLTPMTPPAPKTIYEVVLGHYIQTDKPRFRELLERWPAELFDVRTVATALENQLTYRDVREDSVEGGERGRDWRIVLESLARLHEASGRHREALRCYIKLQDADSAFRLIRDFHLADAVADDVPGFIGLRVAPGREDSMSSAELEEATAEAVTLLVDEAQRGLLRPREVVSQLEEKGLDLYLFFYLRGLWKGEGCRDDDVVLETRDRLLQETKSLVDEFGDLAVRLFAKYDRQLLMEFLKTSTSYAFEKVCFSPLIPLPAFPNTQPAHLGFHAVLTSSLRKGRPRVRAVEIRRRARLPVLEDGPDEARAVPHHRPAEERAEGHRLRQGAGRPGPVGGPAGVQHGQAVVHPRAAGAGGHGDRPHHAGAADPRGSGDPRAARGDQAHHEGARDPVLYQRGCGEGAAERGCRRAG